MKGPPSMHTNFFSSLKQVEKRLKLENQASLKESSSLLVLPPTQPSQASEKQCTSTQSLGSPIYIHLDRLSNRSSAVQDSEPPCEFFSNSHEFPSTDEHMNQEDTPQHELVNEFSSDVDDIELLMQLLDLTDSKEKYSNVLGEQSRGCIKSRGDGDVARNCLCDDGFYGKIVGFEGPKCEREVSRMEGWIKYFGKSGQDDRIEPLRLAHLLLCKAAFVSWNSGVGCSEGLQFPSTILEFLEKDPPIE